MSNWLKVLLLVVLSFKAQAEGCPQGRPDLFCITPEMAPDSRIKVFDFYSVPYKITQLFQEELDRKRVNLQFDLRWESPYFGAGVSLYQGIHRLMVYGGTTRVPGLAVEAYAAMICHEVGHILGGSPYQTIPFAQWSSSEGQADFFAASVCLPKYFKEMLPQLDQMELSKKIEEAGFNMMWSFRNYDSSGGNSILNRYQKDESVVKETLINLYPSIQCRYENFRNPTQRPACWFKK